MDVITEPERSALGVLGKLETLGKCQVIVELLAIVFDQRILHDIQEVIAGRAAVVLHRVEPARRDVGVPSENHATLRRDRFGRTGPLQLRRCQPAGRQSRSLQQPASCEHFGVHRQNLLFSWPVLTKPCSDYRSAMQEVSPRFAIERVAKRTGVDGLMAGDPN
jgi:hypothetical protein